MSMMPSVTTSARASQPVCPALLPNAPHDREIGAIHNAIAVHIARHTLQRQTVIETGGNRHYPGQPWWHGRLTMKVRSPGDYLVPSLFSARLCPTAAIAATLSPAGGVA